MKVIDWALGKSTKSLPVETWYAHDFFLPEYLSPITAQSFSPATNS